MPHVRREEGRCLVSRPGYQRPPSTPLGRKSEAFVRRSQGPAAWREKVCIHVYLWPADIARVDALVPGKGGWGTRRGALASIFAHGLAPAEAEKQARERWKGDDPAHEQEKAALHARFIAKGGAHA